MWIFFFLIIWLSHVRKKSCYLFLTMVDLDFTLSIIVENRGKRRTWLGALKTVKGYVEVSSGSSNTKVSVWKCIGVFGLSLGVFWALLVQEWEKCWKSRNDLGGLPQIYLLILVAWRKVNNPMVKIKAFSIWKIDPWPFTGFLKWFSVS